MLLACSGAAPLNASNRGDEVVIVYNTRMPESKAVADYYAQRRLVPTNQIFGFALSTNDDMSRAEFRDALQKPLAQILERNKLWHVGSRIVPATTNKAAHVEWKVVESKIRYAVLCYGVPFRIQRDPNLQEEGMENLRPEMRRNEAAVDSELVLLPLLEQNLPLSGPLGNPVYATTNSDLLYPTNGVLLVSRLDGPSPEIARSLVDKAMEAETNGLWGRAYFDLRNITDTAYKMGDDWIRSASEICRHLGFETIVDENPGTFPAGFPMSQIAIYMGWYDETVSGPFAQPVVEFVPGAFAYHLHSFSAATLRSPTHNWVGPLLAKGATITMGCVDEPYLAGTPDVAVFASRFLFYGFSFGEAAWASQPVVSWQTTVVGDPLYQPCAQNLDLLHLALEKRHSRLVDWFYLRLVNANIANNKQPLGGSAAFLEQLGNTKYSAVLSEKLADLYAALGKPSSAVYTYTEALKLDPSPQQRIQLLLTLGEKLSALDRELEAYGEYQTLLREFPLYPDRLSVYRKLAVLAQKLNKQADAEKYEAEIMELSPPPKL